MSGADTKEGAEGAPSPTSKPKRWLRAGGHRLAGRSGGCRGGVVEHLLGPEEHVEDLIAQTLAQGDRRAGADDAQDQQLAEAAPLALVLLGTLAQGLARVTQRLGRLLGFLVQLLVVEDLRRRLAVGQPTVGLLGVLERDPDVLAQLGVLDDALNIGAGPLRGTARLGRLLLGCHSSISRRRLLT